MTPNCLFSLLSLLPYIPIWDHCPFLLIGPPSSPGVKHWTVKTACPSQTRRQYWAGPCHSGLLTRKYSFHASFLLPNPWWCCPLSSSVLTSVLGPSHLQGGSLSHFIIGIRKRPLFLSAFPKSGKGLVFIPFQPQIRITPAVLTAKE